MKMKLLKSPLSSVAFLFPAAALLNAGLSNPLAAQSATGSAEDAVCLVKLGDDKHQLAIIVPSAAEKAMSDKGFVREPCSSTFATPAAREGYRDAVCHMAATYREDQIVVFERKHGERPGVLCGMAEVAVSQWQLRSEKSAKQ